MDMDIDTDIEDDLHNINIELLEKISSNGNDFEFVFKNLADVINSLNALNRVIDVKFIYLFIYYYISSYLYILLFIKIIFKQLLLI